MSEIKHNPLPWRKEKEGNIRAAGGCLVAYCYYHPKDRDFIVRACNSHYELLEELENILSILRTIHELKLEIQDEDAYDEAIKSARAELAKAKGKTDG